jgi:hypothetical protein
MTFIISVWTDLGYLSSGGRFHERAAQWAQYLQGVGPVEGYRGSTAYAGNVKETARRETCAETFYDAF